MIIIGLTNKAATQ